MENGGDSGKGSVKEETGKKRSVRGEQQAFFYPCKLFALWRHFIQGIVSFFRSTQCVHTSEYAWSSYCRRQDSGSVLFASWPKQIGWFL